jgi:hypothetical protein
MRVANVKIQHRDFVKTGINFVYHIRQGIF